MKNVAKTLDLKLNRVYLHLFSFNTADGYKHIPDFLAGVNTKHCCDLWVANWAERQLPCTWGTEEIVATRNEGCHYVPFPTHKTCGWIPQMKLWRLLWRCHRCTLWGVRATRSRWAGWLGLQGSNGILHSTEVKHSLRRGDRRWHGHGGQITGLGALHAGTKHGTRKRWIPNWSICPRKWFKAPIKRSTIWRTCTWSRKWRKLEHLGRLSLVSQLSWWRENGIHSWGENSLIVWLVICIQTPTSTHGNVALNLFFSSLHIFGSARHFKAWFFVPRRSDNVSIRDLLDTFHRGPLGPHNKTNNTIRHPYIDGDLVFFGRGSVNVWWRVGRTPDVARGTNLRKMLGGAKYFSLCGWHVFWSACDYKDGLFSSHWCLDVGVGFCTQGLNLATYTTQKDIDISLHMQVEKKTTLQNL